ncbi:sodium/hydrogen exchanger 9B2 [Anopheles nili]|uniref:sodium/hydrogen exchanger 9B2 n=1 Tax=Anopheles nili TaxID=185578 RepID=UPI00237BD92D|nr:sodium/hydrogen exchanger 9B2 [Anopheles nili]
MTQSSTPPRIYITFVEEDTAARNEGGLEVFDGDPRPVEIPSEMVKQRQDTRTNLNSEGSFPLQSAADDGGPFDGFNKHPRTEQTMLTRSVTGTMPRLDFDRKQHLTPLFSLHRCPSVERNWPTTSQPVALLIVFAFLWAVATCLLPSELTHPAGGLMRLVFLFVGAQTCGMVVALTGLPDMLGMLFWGVLYANVGWADFRGFERLEVFLREMALVNIMLLAGLGLDYGALRSLFRFIMLLTLVPTAAEVATVAILSHYLLGLPWLWGVLLGLVETAISPNVVVTVLLRLKEERLGLNKGIHTLIIATTSCNDVLAIFLFGVILGVIFSTGDLTSQILQGPIGIVIGLVYGGLCGFALLHVPSYHAKYTNGLRFSMVALAGTLSVAGSKTVGYPSAGALGCIVTAFVAGTGWRKRPPTECNEVSMYLDLLWKFLKPVSFSLIGKEVNFSVLAGETVLYGAITLLVAVLLRLVCSYLCTMGSELDWREKAYVTLSGLPKATVQAALGPAALDLARSLNAQEEYARAQTVLIVTVLAIILTAPLGALLMIKLAPRWLKRSKDDGVDLPTQDAGLAQERV